ncbi:AraC family transcriptional regulator [Marinobacter sp. CHS3-4]|uniref:AraC family transcriptional regulator n=1 Tax=Marinobacter sp. CHS3-4 TaxID=3045174 RepID=UPI0024B54A9E|nr:AraC family transcriptional regulator [Marinobacter sp. CHS3-4]MDI9243731.1 AraC family transcriptional regulator ligand-binding domain-containing protein [Marinobacter sp. CHS3-4]
MIETSTVTHLYAQAILQAAKRRGMKLPKELLSQVVPGQRVALSVQDRLWDEYCQMADGAMAGLDIGLALQVGHLDSAGMLLISCDTLRDGLEALVEYAPIIGDGGEFRLEQDGDDMRLRYRPAYQVRVPERVEAVMASLVRLTGWATGEAFQPSQLCMRHRPLAALSEYESRLGIPVLFEADYNGLSLTAAQGELPLIQANSGLREHLRQLADRTLASLGQQSLSGQVTRLVRDHPAWGKERVASELSVSGRHLNRLLEGEGLSFKFLRERELHRRALDLLRMGQSVAQVSEQLGFSEEAAFARAFRRWEGISPSKFRLESR